MANRITVTNYLTLELWSDLGIVKDGSNNVSQWQDQCSPQVYGNFNATGASRPVWTDNIIGGKPALHSDGLSTQMIGTKASQYLLHTGASEIWAVWRPYADGAWPGHYYYTEALFMDTYGYIGLCHRENRISNYRYTSAELVAELSPLSNNKNYLHHFYWAGTSLSIRDVITGANSTFSPTASSGYGPNVCLFTDCGSSHVLHGYIGALIVYNEVKTADERSTIDAQLKNWFFPAKKGGVPLGIFS
jgi:hypothetical protein